MADVVYAASAIETSYLRIRRVTSALARTVIWRPGSVEGVWEMDKEVALSDRTNKVIASAPDAYYDFHAMLWWGRSLLYRVDGDWAGPRVKGSVSLDISPASSITCLSQTRGKFTRRATAWSVVRSPMCVSSPTIACMPSLCPAPARCSVIRTMGHMPCPCRTVSAVDQRCPSGSRSKRIGTLGLRRMRSGAACSSS